MPKKEQNRVDDLLHNPKFISYCEKPTAALESYWNNWLQQNPQYVYQWEEARQLYLLVQQERNVSVPRILKEETLKRILSKIETAEDKRIVARKNYRIFFRYAAAALVILVAGYWLSSLNKSDVEPLVRVEKVDAIKQINLPDGTVLSLNKGGTIQYAEKGETRLLQVRGEAYIQVAKQLGSKGETRPFIVNIDGMQVKVLGTKFNVMNNASQKNVVLMEGKVKVEKDGEAMMMHPGEKIAWKNNKLIRQKVNASLYKAWLSGNLILDNTSLIEIIEWLEDARGFQVENRLAATDKQRKLSGNLNLEDEQTLFKTLEKVFNIKIVNNQQRLLIKSVTN